MMHRLACLAALALSACAANPPANPQDGFWNNLRAHCGKAYAGKLASDEAADADFRGRDMRMHVRDCSESEIRIPFHVGPAEPGGTWDRSRTWVISRTASGLRLKHDHRHEDGSEDRLSQYGGDTASTGSATAQSFPADAESIALFRREGLDRSVSNVWEIEIDTPTAATPRFAYVLRRTGEHARFFRVEFNLRRPVGE